MATDKKYKGKINESNVNDWLASTGYLFATNEIQLDRFNKIYEDYDFKLKDITIDVDSIVNGTFCISKNSVKIPIEKEIDNEIEHLKMVARKGQSGIPKNIINKMLDKHKKRDDDSQ
uniref:hypothetical protein n=1 Tax=Chryseobacterium sp. TaxID=1871047 RepID=UPI001597E670|nr:hypothetical protein [Chryseobacterium sp.]QJS06491.1 putative antitoxin of TA system [Chryseobacterium sp.]